MTTEERTGARDFEQVKLMTDVDINAYYTEFGEATAFACLPERDNTYSASIPLTRGAFNAERVRALMQAFRVLDGDAPDVLNDLLGQADTAISRVITYLSNEWLNDRIDTTDNRVLDHAFTALIELRHARQLRGEDVIILTPQSSGHGARGYVDPASDSNTDE